MKKLLVEFLQNKENEDVVIWYETPIFVPYAIIPFWLRFVKLFDLEVYHVFLLDYLTDKSVEFINVIRNPSVVYAKLEQIGDSLDFRTLPICSHNLSSYGYENFTSDTLEKTISEFLPDVKFTCTWGKYANAPTKFSVKIQDNHVDFGALPVNRDLFTFLKALVASKMINCEITGDSNFSIDLEDLDSLLYYQGSGELMKKWYPSRQLLHSLSTGLIQENQGKLLSSITRIPEAAIFYFKG